MPDQKDGRGVYLAHSPDMTVIVPFGNELECLRFAVENQLTYKRAPYGQNLMSTPNVARPARKRRTRKVDPPPAGLLGTAHPARIDIIAPIPPEPSATDLLGPLQASVDAARDEFMPEREAAQTASVSPATGAYATDDDVQAEPLIDAALRLEGHPGGLDEFMATARAHRAERALGITPDTDR
jgi:hypothetical protein